MRLSHAVSSLVFLASSVLLVGCGCHYSVTSQQPMVFNPSGGQGSFTIHAGNGCKWNADEDMSAEDWVKVAGGVITGSGSMSFNVLSAAQQPNVPLPRTGFINVYQDGSGGGPSARVEIRQQ